MTAEVRHHKATPIDVENVGISLCFHCMHAVKRVPGGQGSTWVHVETGAVAGSGREVPPESVFKAMIDRYGIERVRQAAHDLLDPLLAEEEPLAELDIAWAWECPFCTAAVEHGHRGEQVSCRKCGQSFRAGG